MFSMRRVTVFAIAFVIGVIGAMWPALRANADETADRHDDASSFQRLYPAMEAFLVDADGGGFELTIDVKDRNLFPGPTEVFVKVYDPAGRVVVREELPDLVKTGAYESSISELDYYSHTLRRGVPPMVRWSGLSDTLAGVTTQSRTFRVPNRGKGVYRVLVLGDESHWVRLSTSRRMKRGVLPDPNWLAGADDAKHTRYVFVPKGTQAFHLYFMELDRPQSRRLRVLDPSGKVLVDMKEEGGDGSLIRHAELPVKAYAEGSDFLSEIKSAQVHRNENDYLVTNYLFRSPAKSLDDQVLRVEIDEGAGDYLLSLVLDHPSVMRPFGWGDPLGDAGLGPSAIFCDDEATAIAIAGGATMWRDGTALWHGYQLRGRQYIDRFKPSDFLLNDADGSPLQWVTPGSHIDRALYGIYPWGVSKSDPMVTMSQRINDVIATLDDPTSMDELFTKLPVGDKEIRALAIAYTQPIVGNEYYGQPAVLRLATLGMIKRFCTSVSLGDRPPMSRTTCCVTYAIGYGFHVCESVLWLKDLVDADARAILAEGMTMVGDRAAYLMTVSNNAAAHMPLILEHVAQMTDDPYSRMLADRNLDRWINAERGWEFGVTPSGDVAEYLGHGGQYPGYSWAPIARLYLITKKPELLEVIRRGFDLHAHTSLPQLRMSSNSWASRTAGTYQDWATASVYMPEIVPNMSLLSGSSPAGYILTGKTPMRDDAEPLISPPGMTYAFVDRSDFKKPAWPMDGDSSFTRNINDGSEWFAVKRPTYYALVFAGKLAPVSWNDVWGGYCGFTGGTLCTLYRPGKGPVIVSKKTGSAYYGETYGEWAKTVSHDVAGNMVDGREIRLGDSRATPTMDGNRLVVQGTGRNAPLNFTRAYDFKESSIRVTLDVSFIGVGNGFLHKAPKPAIATLQEIIPFVDHKAGVELFNAAGVSLGKVGETWVENVKSLQIGTVDEGCRIVFDDVQAVKAGASLWIRLIDQPTPSDQTIPSLAYTIEM